MGIYCRAQQKREHTGCTSSDMSLLNCLKSTIGDNAPLVDAVVTSTTTTATTAGALVFPNPPFTGPSGTYSLQVASVGKLNLFLFLFGPFRTFFCGTMTFRYYFIEFRLRTRVSDRVIHWRLFDNPAVSRLSPLEAPRLGLLPNILPPTT